MARRAEDLDPVVVPVDHAEPTTTLQTWLELVLADEPVELGTSAAEILAEARAAGEV